MSMRDFMEGNCGQLNPVLKVASHFTQDVSLRESLGSGVAVAAAAAVAFSHPQDFLQEQRPEVSLLPPTTFRMDSLLHEIQSAEQVSPNLEITQGPSVSHLMGQTDWAEDFLRNDQNNQVHHSVYSAWAHDYAPQADLDTIWDYSRESHAYQGDRQQQKFQSGGFQHQNPQEFLQGSNWEVEYMASSASPNLVAAPEKSELMRAADELVKSVSDPSIKATEFMNYVEKLSSGEVKSANSNQQESDAAKWANEYDFQYATSDTAADWIDNFAGQADLGPGPSAVHDNTNTKEDFWNKLETEWQRLAEEESASHPWLAESTPELNQVYKFNESNPFLSNPTLNPLEEGKRRLLEGDIPSAVLAFEAAVQQLPENEINKHEIECWLLLGSTQAQNEQDPLAISALNKCLQLDPSNLTALMAIAASLTNESYQLQACNALNNWLKSNPKYSHLVTEDRVQGNPRISSVLPHEELVKVQKAFMKAARLNPTVSVDADVQSGLGILFNLSSDYDKAVECFQAALVVKPEDSLLWNRLGATLANGGKSTEAVGAYRQALEISPGFIRTRYNLGISCVNLNAYREAAEHFLSALNQQAAGKPSASSNNSNSNVMSNSIWSSLRMILHLMDRSELSSAIDSRDLPRLNAEFNINQ